MLDVKGLRAGAWEVNIYKRSEGHIALLPPIDGWVLAPIGLNAALDTAERADSLAQKLMAISKDAGECHYYGSYRVADFIDWMIARKGTLERGFAFVGRELIFEQGEPTEIEWDI